MKNIKLILVLFILVISCSDIIEVEDISNKNVSVLAPTEGAILTTTSVQFSWNAVNDADRYKLQIARPDFENATAIKEDSSITGTYFSKVLGSGSYQWRVRAENAEYQTVYTIQGFSITESDAIDISNQEVVLLAPANAIVFNTTDTINFSWETILNAENYTIQIATPNFQNAVEIIENEIVTTTNFSISSLEAQDYEWRVKAQNLEYETGYTFQGFTIEE